MRLIIISHTEHYYNQNGNIVGHSSTVTEINHLLNVFDSIVHLAMLYPTEAPKNTTAYLSNNIKFVPIPSAGGTKLKHKIKHIYNMPKTLYLINKYLKGSDYFQFRAPTGIGVFVIPYLIILKNKKKGWFKYAGNWNQNNASLSYKFQKWLLNQQSKKVTINGSWSNQNSHCLSFENPCLTRTELETGENAIRTKCFDGGLELCFVGRLESEKGLDLIIEALSLIPNIVSKRIAWVHFVGAGKKLEFYKLKCEELSINYRFHGLLSRIEVHEIFKKCHFILLPSKSEGFPKVLAEAMNYGCVPIVSNVSSIGQYIKNEQNGFLIEPLDPITLKKQLKKNLFLNKKKHGLLIENKSFLKKFTYQYYNNRIVSEILISS